MGTRVKKQKASTSVGRKIPSSQAFLERGVSVNFGWLRVLDWRGEGEIIGSRPVVVLEELGQELQDCARFAETAGAALRR